ncbi:cell adhesion molecule Dscam2-like [Macrobrachium nipponense]|uniref:cell adhesion molecule Dscam2-like n=1 Tax=Macrobrachium nipponense TaxID=159736 RepID=UPI0030C7E453
MSGKARTHSGVLRTLVFLSLLILLIAIISCSGVGGSVIGGVGIGGGGGGRGGAVRGEGPRLTVTPPLYVVFSSGSGVVLGCLAEGSPPPVVTWVTGEGRPLSAQSPYIDILANGSLAA